MPRFRLAGANRYVPGGTPIFMLTNRLREVEDALAAQNRMGTAAFLEWLDSEEVKPFFVEFELDCLKDTPEFPGRPLSSARYFNMVTLFQYGAARCRQGDSHGMKFIDKTGWTLCEHWAWFTFQVWWKARHSTTLSPWPGARAREARRWPAPRLYHVLEYLQVVWSKNSLTAWENREEAEAEGWLPAVGKTYWDRYSDPENPGGVMLIEDRRYDRHRMYFASMIPDQELTF